MKKRNPFWKPHPRLRLVDPQKLDYSYEMGSLAHNLVVQTVDVDPWSRYEAIQQLGVGSMGRVTAVRVRSTPPKRHSSSARHDDYPPTPPTDTAAVFALKTLRPGRLTSEFVAELKNEIRAIRLLDHPHIIKFHEVYYVNNKNIHILMEYCPGGDLRQRKPLSENQSASVMQQLLSALAYMHAHNVVHRDIKMENILIANSSGSASSKDDLFIKVIDFGLSARYSPQQHRPLTAPLGTLDTMAPEVFKGNYTTQADVWSAGVVLFELLTGRKPFTSTAAGGVVAQIAHGNLQWYPAGVTNNNKNNKTNKNASFSKRAQRFCQALLDRNPERRPTAAQALKRPWLTRMLLPPDPGLSADSRHGFSHQVKAYAKSSLIKKIGLLLVAHKLVVVGGSRLATTTTTTQQQQQEFQALQHRFEQFDPEQTGSISWENFRAALRGATATPPSGGKSSACLDLSESAVRALFVSLDTYHTGREIAYTEFMAALLESYTTITEDDVRDAFCRLDHDKKGYLSVDNLRRVLGRDFSPDVAGEIMDAVQPAQPGKISYQEFLWAFREPHQPQEDHRNTNFLENLLATWLTPKNPA